MMKLTNRYHFSTPIEINANLCQRLRFTLELTSKLIVQAYNSANIARQIIITFLHSHRSSLI